MSRAIPNPAYETAQYTVHFCIGIPVPAAVRRWSRKRRMKWMRRKKVKMDWPFMPDPVLQEFDAALWAGELDHHHAMDR